MWPFILIIAFLSILQDCFGESKCISLDVSITQKVENNGFHRHLHWLIEIVSPTEHEFSNANCNLSVQLISTPGMFINPDEIGDLNRVGELSAYIDGKVDIEQPAHEAHEHTVYVFLPNRGIERISVNLPIHLRYQRAQIGGGFGKVVLKKPSLLAHCEDSPKKICGRGLLVEAPCTVAATDICIWKNVTYKSLIDETELFVPVGDLDDYPIVSIVTLLLGCAGCIYVLSILSTRPL